MPGRDLGEQLFVSIGTLTQVPVLAVLEELVRVLGRSEVLPPVEAVFVPERSCVRVRQVRGLLVHGWWMPLPH
jgi:hypothetical protein